MGKKRGVSRKKLLRYFRTAAELSGRAGEGSVPGRDCYEDGQAFYSLLWYYRSCIDGDLDKADPRRYAPLLDAYLGTDVDEVLHPPAIDPALVVEEDRLLAELFPQSPHPLNANQRLAVHKALHYPLSIIKGPPGTGKTETILRIVALAVACGERVAVVSTNAAAVENVERKVAAALAFHGEKTLAQARELFDGDLAYRAACAHAALGSKALRQRACDPLTGANLAFEAGEHEFPDGERIGGWELNKRLGEFAAKFPFVTSTVHSLKKCFADGDVEKYDLLIMDEASQTNLIVGVVAMSCARRMVLVGDEEQLPPVITDEHCAQMRRVSDELGLFKRLKCDERSPYDIGREGLSFLSSCYEVFSDRNPELRTMLTEHYRCHPAIIGFCNEAVYEGQLVVKTPVRPGDAPCPIRICWYEGDYREGTWPPSAPPEEQPNKKTRSTCVNRKQLAILREEEAAHLRSLAERGKSICILSPFRGQIYLLKSLVQRLLKDVVAEGAVELEVGEGEEFETSDLEQVYTLTVHKSQGQEFDAVYLLPVEDGNWEWPWSQGRRLVNVAASRAKEELCVILSTKLLDGEAQERLAGRQAYVKKPARAEDDPGNQEMFVRKLVEYAHRTIEGLSVEEADQQRANPWFGFHRSAITSIFDDIPFLQNPRKRGGDHAPEQCVERALRGMDLSGLAFAKHVTFDQLRLGGDGPRLSERCEDEYQSSSEAHFDFVVFDPATGRVAMAIEADGGHHRFDRKAGPADCSRKLADDRKNAVARDVCHATLAWLGLIRDGSLHPGSNAQMRMGEAEYRTGWEDWAHFPKEVGPGSSFVFLRIPSDGSTFWETEALRAAALSAGADKLIDGYPPPTIEAYLRAQLRAFEAGEAEGLFVMGKAAEKKARKRLAACPAAQEECPKKITACLEEWRRDPRLAPLLEGVEARDVNACLLRAGYQYLEDGDWDRRKPTALGEEIGISTYSGERMGRAFSCPQYSQAARDYLAERMGDILKA
ncbi:AAA domain-containing protein [Arabiibacter massiliensis]|uniref:AAA domain-containing protein n=1 Tax=Arabiibacter massiliensis TaxID=1870985 RepID=UPI0009BAC941|nr:AAA domain-containing protein [Arabiibacter massiliensis]